MSIIYADDPPLKRKMSFVKVVKTLMTQPPSKVTPRGYADVNNPIHSKDFKYEMTSADKTIGSPVNV